MTAGPRHPFLRWFALACLVVSAACGDDPTAGDTVCADQPAVTVGSPVGGVLRSGDARFADALIDYYALRLDAPAELEVRLASTAFNPLLLVFDDAGDVVAQAFLAVDPGDGVEAAPSLVRAFPAGCTLIGVSSYDLDGTGAYVLTVQPTL